MTLICGLLGELILGVGQTSAGVQQLQGSPLFPPFDALPEPSFESSPEPFPPTFPEPELSPESDPPPELLKQGQGQDSPPESLALVLPESPSEPLPLPLWAKVVMLMPSIKNNKKADWNSLNLKYLLFIILVFSL